MSFMFAVFALVVISLLLAGCELVVVEQQRSPSTIRSKRRPLRLRASLCTMFPSALLTDPLTREALSGFHKSIKLLAAVRTRALWP